MRWGILHALKSSSKNTLWFRYNVYRTDIHQNSFWYMKLYLWLQLCKFKKVRICMMRLFICIRLRFTGGFLPRSQNSVIPRGPFPSQFHWIHTSETALTINLKGRTCKLLKCCIKKYSQTCLRGIFFFCLKDLELCRREKKVERTGRWEEGIERPQCLGGKHPSCASTRDV